VLIIAFNIDRNQLFRQFVITNKVMGLTRSHELDILFVSFLLFLFFENMITRFLIESWKSVGIFNWIWLKSKFKVLHT
jgi:hypothetical protein